MPDTESTVAREFRLAESLAWTALHLRHASTTLIHAVQRAQHDVNLVDEVAEAETILTSMGRVLQAVKELAETMPDARMPEGTRLVGIRHDGCQDCGEMAFEAAHTLLHGQAPRAKAYSGDMAHWAEVTMPTRQTTPATHQS